MKALPSFLGILYCAASIPAFPADNTLITPVPAPAVRRAAVVQISVRPDHSDWTYKPGEKVTFTIQVIADQFPLKDATVTYSVGQSMMPTSEQTAAIPPEGLKVDGGTMNEPGFIRCIAHTEVNGQTYRNLATAGFDPGSIQPTQVEPSDFDEFWQAGIDELATIPMEPRVTLIPEACTDSVNVYHVSFRVVGKSWNGNARIYGILCEPKKPGKYPAILNVPGAGIRPYFGDIGHAARGAITLEIGIHGIPVNLNKEVYDQLQAGPLNNYWNFNLDDKNEFYYRRVYLGCLRANDFLTSRKMWNGKDLVVAGKSQGGQLSIVTAALDPRVTGLSATHPAFCDVTGYLHGRAGGWPHSLKPDSDGTPSKHATPAKIETTAYYDTLNFARRLKVPGHYTWGYNDETTPPTSTFAAFNVITAPKQLTIQLQQGHQYPREQDADIDRWMSDFLGWE